MSTRSAAAYGRTDWGRRWMALVESMAEPGRYSRGLGYARNDHVTLPSIEPGVIRTHVRGSQPAPFQVTITLRTLDQFQLDELITRLRDEPGVLTRVVGGAMPELLADAALPEARDFRWSCTCPDPGDPCKHAVATLCDIALLIDQNPGVLLVLRGADPEVLLRGVEWEADGDGPAAPGPIDHFGNDLALPPLPALPADGATALEVLDANLLRRALRGIDPDDASIGWGVEDLRLMYRRLIE
ncbi:SWIM zinc finger family protein [Millisia brevis]|uniref:SWIM zinc finger family protein n=1 Tax=Millisia brevis TaxID=264148 RepID=UPI000A035016|nr:SWIM zinc finger family protein [Millisia brevis]